MKISTTVALFLLTAILISKPAASYDINRLALRHLITEAELIFLGTVEGIEYRTSNTKTEDDVALPHTFVSFNIEKILKGKTSTDSITLRFQGGRIKAGNGEFEYLIPSLIPLFDIGDQDILFVKGDGKSICPLVSLREGRFRVIEDHIYTDLGYPVGLSEDLVWTLPFLRNDIIRPLDLFNRLLNPESRADKTISSQLSKVVHESLQAAVKAGPHSAAALHARHLLARNFNDISGINNLKFNLDSKKTQSAPEIIPRRLLLERDMADVRLRDQTKRLLRKDARVLSPREGAILNRLLLEDLYHTYVVRSLKRSLVRLPFDSREMPATALEAIMTHEALCVDCRFERRKIDSGGGYSDGLARSPKKETYIHPVAKEFVKHLMASVQKLHTEEELNVLSAVPSVQVNEPFYVKAAKPGRPQLDLMPSKSDIEQQRRSETLEVKAMIKSGFNPVLRMPRVE